jgi:endonuclease/exonuclease/phosphatase family metal-dependent hydrolase
MKIKFRRLSFLIFLVSIVGLAALIVGCTESRSPAVSATPEGYLFCFWNVENFFDDQEDDRLQGPDREYDRWFANDPAMLKLKLAHLSEALIDMNAGRGPDIIALAELESQRAGELLRDALNSRLVDPSLHYQHVLFKDPHGGRHISTAIITRLSVLGNRTQIHGRRLRILEGHIEVNGHDLVVLATHWTSRLTDKTGDQRAKYGDQCYGVYYGMYRSNPEVDFLVCGDFNDPPDAPSVTEHLHATGDLETMRSGAKPMLLDLFAGKDPNHFGTHYNQTHWYIFDQIVVSPGLLDGKGWSCDPASAQTVNTLVRPGDKHRKPWRFGNGKDRDHGYSDHFPVTVRLKVEGN